MPLPYMRIKGSPACHPPALSESEDDKRVLVYSCFLFDPLIRILRNGIRKQIPKVFSFPKILHKSGVWIRKKFGPGRKRRRVFKV